MEWSSAFNELALLKRPIKIIIIELIYYAIKLVFKCL